MLREMENVRQIEGEHRRRWFSSERMDLTLWVDDAGEPEGFQLAYDDASGARKALTFHKGGSLRHESLDEGEDRPFRYKMSPITIADGAIDYARLRALFDTEARETDPAVREFVLKNMGG